MARPPIPNWFIAFPVQDSSWLAALLQGLPEGIRGFSPADLHLTLAFLGPATEGQARCAWREATAQLPPSLPIRFRRLEAFGGSKNPTAFSLTLSEGHEALVRVMAAQTQRLQALAGAKLETRAPRPHVTVARPSARARGSRAVAEAAQRWVMQASPPDQRVWLQQLSLFTWSAERRERLFEVVETVRLPEQLPEA